MTTLPDIAAPTLTAPVPPLAPAPSRASSGRTRIVATVLVLFALATAILALRKDITVGFDEVAHVSYVAELQRHAGWPRLPELRLIEPATGAFTAQPNYLNHPPIYYAVLAALGPDLSGGPLAVVPHRLLNVVLVTCGLAVLMLLAVAATPGRGAFLALVVPLATIPVLPALAGAVNNDNLAFTGGAAALVGLWHVLRGGGIGWFAAALAGLVAASIAKFTACVLVGSFTALVCLHLLHRGRLPPRWIALAVAAALVSLAPYVALVVVYGSPVPAVPGWRSMIADGARQVGWADAPRLSLPAYLVHFATCFVAEWWPTLRPRGLASVLALAVPAATLLAAAAGAVVASHRIARRRTAPLDVLVAAGTLAIAVTLALHVAFAYANHRATGWMMDAYPRYYLPLIAIVPLAALRLAIALPRRAWRAAALAALAWGPVVFLLVSTIDA